ncbi:helix-turn-helix domain-containing protein [Rossellomorea sp. NS-SX7]|uniref:helix-turn-helix domain-containing protein n=1 Tax=Rossellomorea sp. NS-SX7 TaxID=3463856 RepID=UPI004059AC4C
MHGKLIRYFRRAKTMTQEDLCEGICSVSHLSKIENGNKEVNDETLTLLFNKLEVDFNDLKTDLAENQILIEELERYIIFQDKERAEITFNKLCEKEKLFLNSSYIYRFLLTKYRYYLYKDNLAECAKIKDTLEEHSKILHVSEMKTLDFFNGIYFLKSGLLEDSFQLLHNCLEIESLHQKDLYYYLALASGKLNKLGYAITYAIKALDVFQKSFNTSRTLHVHLLLGILYTQINVPTEAINHLNIVLFKATYFKKEELLVSVHHNLGLLYKGQNDYVSSLKHFSSSQKIAEQKGVNSVSTLYEIVNIYVEQGEKEKGLLFTNQGLKYAEEASSKDYQIKFNMHSMILMGKNKKLAKYVEKVALPYYIETENKDKKIYCYKLLINHYKYLNDEKFTLFTEDLLKIL